MSNENKFPLETLSLRAKLYESKGLTLVINTVSESTKTYKQTSRNTIRTMRSNHAATATCSGGSYCSTHRAYPADADT